MRYASALPLVAALFFAAMGLPGQDAAPASNGSTGDDAAAMREPDKSPADKPGGAAATRDGRGGATPATAAMPLDRKQLIQLRKQHATKPEFRSAWVTRFEWARPDPEETRAQIVHAMELAEQIGLNAVIFQVRGDCTTLYPSQMEPWSHHLGAKDPGFDPLKLAIDEAHKRKLEFHAYFNICTCCDQAGGPKTPHRVWEEHCQPASSPNWLVHQDGKPQDFSEYTWLNTNLPEVQAHIRAAAVDLVSRYDIDGLHYDRVRFPNPNVSDDQWSKARFAGEGNPLKLEWQAWQRDNLNRLLTDIYGSVTAIRPQIKVSAAVWGIYDKTQLPPGGKDAGYSWTSSGLQGYNQDSIEWTRRGCVDALVPMIYWDMGGDKPDYDELLAWFVANRANGRHIYGGQKVFTNVELVRQALAGNLVGAEGLCPFTLFRLEQKKMARFCRNQVFSSPVPVPPMPWKQAPQTGTLLVTVRDAQGRPVKDAQVALPGRKDVFLSSADGFCAVIDAAPSPGCTVAVRYPGGAAAVSSQPFEVVPGRFVTVDVSPAAVQASVFGQASPRPAAAAAPAPPPAPALEPKEIHRDGPTGEVLVTVRDGAGNLVQDAIVTLDGSKQLWKTSPVGVCVVKDVEPCTSTTAKALLPELGMAVSSQPFQVVEGKITGVEMVFIGANVAELRSAAAANTPPSWRVEATSTLEPTGELRYDPANLIDGNKATAWNEGVPGPGIGQRITFQLQQAPQPDAVFLFEKVQVLNGYCKNVVVFEGNMRVKTLAVQVNGTPLATLPLKDVGSPQLFELPNRPVMKPGDTIVFEITETYPGSTWEDTCISELVPIGRWHSMARGQ